MIHRTELDLNRLKIPVYTLNTVVVGSGAAGLNCINRLFREMEECGVENPRDQVALLTRGIGMGTSYNSGSDKQTYYKLGTHSESADLPADFADTLTAGGCTHADVAMIEGANSLRSFYRLADLGVPFPHDGNGSFVGYKTDHDPRQRGTSAGPWTSRFMVQKLLAELQRLGIEVFNRHYMLAVVTTGQGADKSARGLLAVDMSKQNEPNHGLVLFACRNVVVATGGPGELYEISVYPKGQMGSYAALFEAGAEAHNLTESQFGLASINPRWNLSGTYQQVIPRYYSTDQEGKDEQEFLNPWFDSMPTLATDVFLKGYQWPFDHDKVADYGSSLIDILVQNEMINRGRRVFMDFRENPRATDGLQPFKLEDLKPEALDYLKKSGAMQATPIERLAHMNQPSIDLYKQMGVDLWKQPLEIGVCSQHCNGGFAVDAWWESTVPHLFVLGELAGTHGVKRPGGSALNSGQVGGLRAAQRIAHVYHQNDMAIEQFKNDAVPVVRRITATIAQIRGSDAPAPDAAAVKKEIQHRMSASAGMVRSLTGVEQALSAARTQWQQIRGQGLRQPGDGWLAAMEIREMALAQLAYLEAVLALLKRGSGSRGSHLVTDPSGKLPHPKIGAEWRYIPENLDLRKEILGLAYDLEKDTFAIKIKAPNPRGRFEGWFENTWAEYRRAEVFAGKQDKDFKPYKIYQ
ncbi:MAG: FAD-binding protein [Phycisphaerales bacterium]|nr:FAD-binding protein [Phycisphaerales bacterium]